MIECESKTILRDSETVRKDDPQIILRGELDSLYAQSVCICVYADKYGYKDIISGTQDILRVIRELIFAEAEFNKPNVDSILGMTLNELREVSNNPKSELGLEHYLPDENADMMTAQINRLRTDIKRAERAAWAAEENGVNDTIGLILNRLSSAAYILMLESNAL